MPEMSSWTEGITKLSEAFPIYKIEPEKWNNIPLPITETMTLMLQELYRLQIK